MNNFMRPIIISLLFFTLLLGIVYPAASTAIIQLLFPHAANGSLITIGGKPIGSELIGQNFTDAKYFWGRPSATSPVPYNAAASSGSNLGVSNPVLTDAIKARIAVLKAAGPENTTPIPVDLVTASASGLDPHISPAAALYQISRVAKSRNIPEDTIRKFVNSHTEGRQFGILGEPRVNVLKLNLALDGAR